jgi:hypothetical protein
MPHIEGLGYILVHRIDGDVQIMSMMMPVAAMVVVMIVVMMMVYMMLQIRMYGVAYSMGFIRVRVGMGVVGRIQMGRMNGKWAMKCARTMLHVLW